MSKKIEEERKRLSLRIDKKLWRIMRNICTDEDITMTDLILRTIKNEIKRIKEGK